MSDLARAVTRPALQRCIRETMRHSPSFRVEGNLPDALKRRLEELDRVLPGSAAAQDLPTQHR